MDRDGIGRYGRWLVIGSFLAIFAAVQFALSMRDAEAPAHGPSKIPTFTIPVLMYHHVREPGPGLADAASLRFAVSPVEFEKQLDYLQQNGYTTIDTKRLEVSMRTGLALPPRAVMLTFDDGWETQFSTVYPLLRERGMVGVFFVHTGVIGEQPGAAMSWDDVCQMEDDGMDIECHTVSHPSLPQLDAPALERELTDSRAILEAKLGRPVTALAYPYGDFTEREIEAAERAGYRLAFSTEVGLVQRLDEPFEIHRTIVTFGDSTDDFAIKLTELDGSRALLDYRPSITPVPAARTAHVQ
ncbi:MAG: polysaccharide deacetylase family protein [Phycisphaeraceae bacterium]|nr:polysaccharide deacetylase family protein [Phycisphaeraceae bacterium]